MNVYLKHKTFISRGLENLQLLPPSLRPEDEDLDPDSLDMGALGPSIFRLWAYECPLTRGYAVTCMKWNETEQDILAVGYSQNAFASTGKGFTISTSPDTIFNHF